MSLGTEKKHAQAIIERAIELGITYFDTADMYDKGINEKLVGEILKPYQKYARYCYWNESRKSS